MTSPPPANAQDKPLPDQAKIDAMKNEAAVKAAETAVINAEKDLFKAKNDLAKEEFGSFGANFGKEGAMTLDAEGRDKFHVTARSASVFLEAATELVAQVKRQRGGNTTTPILVLQDADRTALQTYWTEELALSSLEAKIAQALKEQAPVQPKALGAGLLSLGTMLSQVAQFTQLFRTNKGVSFTESLLADDVLLDYVATQLPAAEVQYPAGELDRLLSANFPSDYSDRLAKVLRKRGGLMALGDAGKDALAELSALATRIAAQDVATKQTTLFVVLRGEMVKDYMSKDGTLILSVKVVTRGGISMKTSSIWSGERLFAAGGIIVHYRIAATGKESRLLTSGVVTRETGFVEVKLK